MPKLTDVAVKQAKPKDKAYYLPAGDGLRLLVKPNGTKAWRYNYRFDGKQKTLALGVYPTTTLKKARDGLLDAKQHIKDGIDPSLEKKRQRRQSIVDSGNAFEALAKDWWEHRKGKWSEDHAQRIWTRLKDNVFPTLGHRNAKAIDPQDIIAVIRKIERRGAIDVAARVLSDIRRIFAYGVQEGRLKVNPGRELTSEVIAGRKTVHRASLPREQLPDFLRALDGYQEQGRLLTQLAIQLLILTFVRPGELRGAQWEEFDLKAKVWRIPGPRMKMKTDHIVPLSRQAIAILKLLQPLTGDGELLFPSERRRHEVMSDNTMRRAIFKLGYDGNTEGKSKCVPHGFRATASSILNESGWNPDAIERQLSHMERDGVRAAYTHHARYLDERKKMMQWWANFLDDAKHSGKVVPLFAAKN